MKNAIRFLILTGALTLAAQAQFPNLASATLRARDPWPLHLLACGELPRGELECDLLRIKHERVLTPWREPSAAGEPREEQARVPPKALYNCSWRCKRMSTFVLVHGAWQTASTWDLVTPLLKSAGHQVEVPRLSGLENDATPLSPAVGLETHIEDVLAAITRDDLHEVTLVGHSYAGMIITGVAERAPRRLKRLVYADAFIPRDGHAVLDLLPEAISRMFRQQADEAGGGWLLRAGEGHLDLWGLQPGPERDFVRSRLSDFSLRCFSERISLPENAAAKLSRTFIACVAEGYPARAVFQRFGDQARSEGWDYHELATGHDCHVEKPREFVSLLLAAVAQR